MDEDKKTGEKISLFVMVMVDGDRANVINGSNI